MVQQGLFILQLWIWLIGMQRTSLKYIDEIKVCKYVEWVETDGIYCISKQHKPLTVYRRNLQKCCKRTLNELFTNTFEFSPFHFLVDSILFFWYYTLCLLRWFFIFLLKKFTFHSQFVFLFNKRNFKKFLLFPAIGYCVFVPKLGFKQINKY